MITGKLPQSVRPKETAECPFGVQSHFMGIHSFCTSLERKTSTLAALFVFLGALLTVFVEVTVFLTALFIPTLWLVAFFPQKVSTVPVQLDVFFIVKALINLILEHGFGSRFTTFWNGHVRRF